MSISLSWKWTGMTVRYTFRREEINVPYLLVAKPLAWLATMTIIHVSNDLDLFDIMYVCVELQVSTQL